MASAPTSMYILLVLELRQCRNRQLASQGERISGVDDRSDHGQPAARVARGRFAHGLRDRKVYKDNGINHLASVL